MHQSNFIPRIVDQINVGDQLSEPNGPNLTVEKTLKILGEQNITITAVFSKVPEYSKEFNFPLTSQGAVILKGIKTYIPRED